MHAKYEHLSTRESGSWSIWSNFSNRPSEIELDIIDVDFESVLGSDIEVVSILGGGKNLFFVKGESVRLTEVELEP